MAEPSRSTRSNAPASPRTSSGATAANVSDRTTGAGISWVRTGLSLLLVLAGIAWLAVYVAAASEGGQLAWMGDLARWNYLIGFGLILFGLILAAHPSTPMGRGRGVVVGMLGCFLIGLVWIVVYYMSATATVPLLTDLAQYNLVVGIGFMAVGFVYATKWE